MNRQAIAFALLSAALFGVSMPAAKMLLGVIDPSILAGLFYCGAGLGVAVLRRGVRFAVSPAAAREAALTWAEAPWLAGAVLAVGKELNCGVHGRGCARGRGGRQA